MREKVCLRVSLPATQRSYEFLVPWDISVREVACIMSRLLSTREGARYRFDQGARVMLLDGERAGELLEGSSMVRRLVREGLLADGSSLALV